MLTAIGMGVATQPDGTFRVAFDIRDVDTGRLVERYQIVAASQADLMAQVQAKLSALSVVSVTAPGASLASPTGPDPARDAQLNQAIVGVVLASL